MSKPIPEMCEAICLCSYAVQSTYDYKNPGVRIQYAVPRVCVQSEVYFGLKQEIIRAL